MSKFSIETPMPHPASLTQIAEMHDTSTVLRTKPIRSILFSADYPTGKAEVIMPEQGERPIRYDDEYGLTNLWFTAEPGVDKYGGKGKIYDIVYQHNGGTPYGLSQFLASGFSIGSARGHHEFAVGPASSRNPVMQIGRSRLQSSRNFLLGVGHEIGHTHQAETDKDLWGLLVSNLTGSYVEDMRRKHPTLSQQIDDLLIVRRMPMLESKERFKLADEIVIKQHPLDFVDGYWGELHETADFMVSQYGSGAHPALGLTYGSYSEGFRKHYPSAKYGFPGVFEIMKSTGEQVAWEYAIDMVDAAILHPGFSSRSEMFEFIRGKLKSFHRSEGVKAYTQWLDKENS